MKQIRELAGSRDDPTEKVNVRARMDLARQLTMSGKLDEATDEYAWLWQHCLQHDRAWMPFVNACTQGI